MPTLDWYVRRLRLMSVGEVAWRLNSAASAAVQDLIPARPAPAGDVSRARLPAWTPPSFASAQSHLREADEIMAGRITIFGRAVTFDGNQWDWNRDPIRGVRCPMTRGASIDCRDPGLVGDARTVWELNRHFALVGLAQAWATSGDAAYRKRALAMLESWLTSCPYPLGVNWASAMESGIRLINWYLASRLLGCWQGNSEPVNGWSDSIYWHCHFIERHQSRYSSANNHLIGEMAGLFVASCAWPLWKESRRWREVAKASLVREVALQVHADGVGREQTNGYQVFVLQFLLLAGLVGEECGDPFPAEYWAAVQKMIHFLESIADRNDNLPGFGDSDDGMAYALSPRSLQRRLADLREVGDWLNGSAPVTADADSLAAWLSAGFVRPGLERSPLQKRDKAFPQGGYYVLGHDLGGSGEVLVVMDAAPLGYLSIAAHGHADCLSFVMSIAGQPMLVDPGTYCYFEEPEWRDYFRSTFAHNTVRVDRLEQSVMAGPFMWLTKARPTVDVADVDGSAPTIRASHDGYQRLADPVVHHRELVLNAAQSELIVKDRFDCSRQHVAEVCWHFAPEVTVEVRDDHVQLRRGAVRMRMQCMPGGTVSLLQGGRSPIGGWVSRRFGSKQESSSVIVESRVDRDSRLETRFSWEIV